MATIKVKNKSGEDAGTLELNDAVFGIRPNVHCVRAALHQYLAGHRAGTHSTKSRGAVRGGGRKPWRQKGTGRARQGSIRAVQWRGGGIAFGPHPRDYSYRLNRKVKQNALRSALSELAQSERLIAIEEFGLDAPKTQDLNRILASMDLGGGSTLLILDKPDPHVLLSARNMPSVHCALADSPNIYDLLAHDRVVATTSALKRMEEVFA